MICFLCDENINENDKVCLECRVLFPEEGKEYKVYYKYFCRECFEESGLSIDRLKEIKNGYQYCPWCKKDWHIGKALQIVLEKPIVISRPCINCWNINGIDLNETI